jgi:MFS transporter, ACS family, D-galactonate transporter
MSATATDLSPGRGGLPWLWRRQLDSYPDTGPRILYLAITVLATITLYYELYVGGSVSTLILANLGMSFTFFVLTLAFGALIGAFGSLFAGLADRFGRANLVVFGLLFTGIFVAFVIPTATDKWVYTVETFVVGFVEGMCLVATPALIRDFSPQLGRATAMGFWTSGPVVGSLIVSIVGTNTVPAIVHSNRFWTHEYTICGIAGVIVFLVALVGLRELSPRLRDQLMVTMRDRALIEARAKGIDVESMLRHPWRQLLKADVVVSSLAISIFLLIYYSAVAFLVIYMVYVFGFSVKDANGLGNWEWGLNVAAVILIGLLSDRLRVRKPFMVVGGAAAAVMTVVFLLQFGHHPGYYTMAAIVAALSFCLGVAYVPWMASFTETVEARNPALIATGLAIWGWIIRIVVFLAYLIIPLVITSVTPLVNYGATVQAYATTYKAELAFASSHADIVATAQKIPPSVLAIAKTDAVQLANAAKFAPELAVIQANPALFAQLAAYPNPAKIPAPLAAKAVTAAGGGAKGLAVLDTIDANSAAISGVIAAGPQLTKVAPYAADLTTIAPYSAQLTALSKVPPSAFTYLKAHGAAVTKAAAGIAGQWRDWWWICFGGMIFFLLTIPLLRGRWRPSDAKRDEQEHEAMVAAELAKLST